MKKKLVYFILLMLIINFVPTVSSLDYVYADMEDNTIPQWDTYRGTYSVDSTSLMNGTYCLNISYSYNDWLNNGVLSEKYVFDTVLEVTNFSFGLYIHNFTNTTINTFSIKDSSGTDLVDINFRSNNSIYIQLTGGTTAWFDMTWVEDEQLNISFGDISYTNENCSVTVQNSTSSETITDVNMGSSTATREIVSFNIRATGTVPPFDLAAARYFLDDFTVGENVDVTTDSMNTIGTTTATFSGTLVDEGDGSDTTAGTYKFYYDTDTGTTISDYSNNVAVTTGTYTDGDTLTADVTGLTEGQLYYYRLYGNASYANSNRTSEDTGNEMIFLSKPEAPTSVSSGLVNSTAVNISWTKGSGANTTLVVQKTGLVMPTSITDGTIIYNGTDSYHVIDNLENGDEFSFRLWSYANWTAASHYYHYSDSSSDVIWGGLGVNVYDEEDQSALTGWGFFMKNKDGSDTYQDTNAGNPLVLNTSDLPTGGDCSITINLSGYSTRVFYKDIQTSTHYILNAYLASNTSTESYVLRVINEYDEPVPGARITIRRFIGGEYENVSIWNVDANGYCTVSLIPDEVYLAVINASGYITSYKDLYPLTISYVEDRYHSFRLEFTDIDIRNESDYNANIVFNGYISGGILYVNYTDSLTGTTDTQIKIYQWDTTNNVVTTWYWDNRSSDNDFQLSQAVNSTFCYEIKLYLNHTTYGVLIDVFIICAPSVPGRDLTTKTDFDDLFNLNYGTNPFGWSNVFMWFVMVACLFSFGQRNSGVSLMLCGGLALFINMVIGFHISGVTIPAIFISLGILVQWNYHRRES